MRKFFASPLRVREASDGYLFICRGCSGLLIFTLYPFVSGFYYSLSDFDALTPAGGWAWTTIRRILFEDELFWLAVYNTAWYVGGVRVAAGGPGFPAGRAAEPEGARASHCFARSSIMPSIVPRWHPLHCSCSSSMIALAC